MNQINLEEGKISYENEWMSTEDLTRKIQEKMQLGDRKFAGLAAALEKLESALENSHTLEIKLTISKNEYLKLKKLGGEDDRECIRKAIANLIRNKEPAEPEKDPAVSAHEPTEMKTVVNCSKCKTPIEVPTDERPIEIRCPNCNAKGRLSSNDEGKIRFKNHFLG
jgi:DNA-directed RNA polymerase subunit RPC12/RpoP